MGLITRNQTNIEKNESIPSGGDSNNASLNSSQYHEGFHENVYGDIDDLLGLDILETCYESPEEISPIAKYNNIDCDDKINENGKLVTINSFCSETSSLRKNILDNSTNNSNMSLTNNPSYTQHHSFYRSHSSVKRSSSATSPETGPKVTIFTDDDYKYMDVIRDESESVLNTPSLNNVSDSKRNINYNNKNNEINSPLSATETGEFVHRNSISNFFNNHFKGKKSKKKEEYKSNPELLNNNNNSFYNDNHKSPRGEYHNVKQRSNTLGSISPIKSVLSMNKRSSFIDIKRQNGMNSPNKIISPLSPLGYDNHTSKKIDSSKNDIDSILVLADEKENVENNVNSTVTSPKNKKLENKALSNSTFFSHIKRRKDRKSMNSLNCITTNIDIMQRKKSFIYSADIISGSNYGSVVLPSATTPNPSMVTTTQNSNSQIILNEDTLNSSPKSANGKHNEFYHLPDYSDLLVMSESDIEGIYNTMIGDNDKVNQKKKRKNNIIKEKEVKDKEFTTIIPLKTVEDKDECTSPMSVPSIVIPVVQNNKEDPLRKSYKVLNESFQMGSIYDVNTPQAEEKNLTLSIDDDNILVVINPFGIRDIDFSTRRVLPVTNKENCSEDVDDLFNIENDDKYKTSVKKLIEIESNYKHCKCNSDVAVNDPDQPNDIDNLFLLSSSLEKKMSVMDSLIVIDDIQENIRPDISDLISIGTNDNDSGSKLTKSSLSSSTPNSINNSRNIFRRFSKSFSFSNNKLNSRVIESSPLNAEDYNYKMERVLTQKNVLVIPSYTDISKSNNDLFEKKSTQNSNIDISTPSQNDLKYSNDLLNNKNMSVSLSRSCNQSYEEEDKNSPSMDRINSPIIPRKSNINALNYIHSISKSFSNDGLVVIRSNDNIRDENNNEERIDYIYYNRDNDKRKTKNGSVMDDFIEFSTINNNLKKKIINDSISTFRTAYSTVKDYYNMSMNESMYSAINYNSINSNFSIANNSNTVNYYRQRDRLPTSMNIKNELYYSDYINNNNSSSINNLKLKNEDISVIGYNPSIFSSIGINYYTPINSPSSLVDVNDKSKYNISNKTKSDSRDVINETNQALIDNSIFPNSIVNKNTGISCYLNISNVMNDSIKNHKNTSLEIPQFTTGYDISNTYISRMHLASSIDIFNRLEILNSSNKNYQNKTNPQKYLVNSKNNSITLANNYKRLELKQ
ncbi:hypothetical protein BCR36DRAFT_405690 [Piromyces finnis]|uniref:Uncharacterized protein n=1 Tax=Piromyces finnis TaxID=1754191 RepID=A0A1Y1V3H8_9FUNG|nr:hypothetical protein BCR36DRAFT_405690 [Piromyces finnis]|eukprot:ORX46407.1 hypothetical protein BCR36DRAFT_405690 [Piromyces finnis]